MLRENVHNAANAALSRRDFLKSATVVSGGLIIAFCLPVSARRAFAQGNGIGTPESNAGVVARIAGAA